MKHNIVPMGTVHAIVTIVWHHIKLYNAISALAIASYWPASWGNPSQPRWQVFNGPLWCAFGPCVCARNTLTAQPSCLRTCFVALCPLRQQRAAVWPPHSCRASFLTLQHAVFCLVFTKRGPLFCERLLLTQVQGCTEKKKKNNEENFLSHLPLQSLQLSLPLGCLSLWPCCVSSCPPRR